MILIQQPTERRKRIGGKEILLPLPFVFFVGEAKMEEERGKRACEKKILYGGNRGIQVGGNASSRRWGMSPTTSANLFFCHLNIRASLRSVDGKIRCSQKNKNIFPCFGRVLKWHAFVATDKNSPPSLFFANVCLPLSPPSKAQKIFPPIFRLCTLPIPPPISAPQPKAGGGERLWA